MNNDNSLDMSKLTVPTDQLSGVLINSPSRLYISLGEDVIRLLTKQADLEAKIQTDFVTRNIEAMGVNLCNLGTNLEGALRYNFPMIQIPGFSYPPVILTDSTHAKLSGSDLPSVLAKGKILNSIVMCSTSYGNIDLEGSLESIFKKHFVYTSSDSTRREDLSSLYPNFFTVKEEEGKVKFEKGFSIINDNNGLLWWDNAPVDISYDTGAQQVTLGFKNGRILTIKANELLPAKEIHYNLNLMIARHLEANYKFYGLVDTQPKENEKIIERNFKEDAFNIYQKTKDEFKELILELVKVCRKRNMTDPEEELILVNDGINEISLRSYAQFYFEKYNVVIKIDPCAYHSSFRYKEKDEVIDFKEFKQHPHDYVDVYIKKEGSDIVAHSPKVCNYTVKEIQDETVVTDGDDLNSNYMFSNYILRSILEDYKESILNYASDYLS